MWSIKCGHKTRHKSRQEKKVCYTHSSYRQGTAGTPGRATWEGHQDGREVEDRSEGRKHLGHGLYWGFHRKKHQVRTE